MTLGESSWLEIPFCVAQARVKTMARLFGAVQRITKLEVALGINFESNIMLFENRYSSPPKRKALLEDAERAMRDYGDGFQSQLAGRVRDAKPVVYTYGMEDFTEVELSAHDEKWKDYQKERKRAMQASGDLNLILRDILYAVVSIAIRTREVTHQISRSAWQFDGCTTQSILHSISHTLSTSQLLSLSHQLQCKERFTVNSLPKMEASTCGLHQEKSK